MRNTTTNSGLTSGVASVRGLRIVVVRMAQVLRRRLLRARLLGQWLADRMAGRQTAFAFCGNPVMKRPAKRVGVARACPITWHASGSRPQGVGSPL